MGRSKILVVTLLLAACAPQTGQISGRNPDLFEKEGQLNSRGRPMPGNALPDMYVKQSEVSIAPVDKPNETGSLFNPDDERNYLFASSGPKTIGRFLDVKVVANRAAPATPAAAPEAPVGKDDAETELLKALPELTPANKGETALVDKFKMKIVHLYPNGDVMAMVSRRSERDDEVSEVTAQARIPFDRLAAGDQLTTADLLDVKFVQSSSGELIDRRSTGWEDEYSLRLSGFDEVKSQMAMELDDKRKQLATAKESLETRIKTFGEERRSVAKQREDLQKKSVETDAKVKTLEDKVEEQEETIEEQKAEIDEMKPEEKPGDEKEGSNG